MDSHLPKRNWLLIAVLAIALYPATASANAGTPLMWATMIHLLVGNLLIGFIEATLLARFFKCKSRFNLFGMILANYVSAYLGGAPILRGLAAQVDFTIINLRNWCVVFAVLAYGVTLLIEFPFVWYLLRKQGSAFGRSIKATIVVNALTYALLCGWYWMASGTSMMTQLSLVEPSVLTDGNGLAVYYITRDGSHIVETSLNGQQQRTLKAVSAESPRDRLFGQQNLEGGYDLWLHSETGKTEQVRNELISTNFATKPPVAEDGWVDHASDVESTYFAFGPINSVIPESPWKFRTGFWPIAGLKGKNTLDHSTVSFALELPFAQWMVRNATQVGNATVVFQLGRDQICILNAETKQIALIARGKGCVVAKPSLANHFELFEFPIFPSSPITRPRGK